MAAAARTPLHGRRRGPRGPACVGAVAAALVAAFTLLDFAAFISPGPIERPAEASARALLSSPPARPLGADVPRRLPALLAGLVAALDGPFASTGAQPARAEAPPTPSKDELVKIAGAFNTLAQDPKEPGGQGRLEGAEATLSDAITKYEGVYREARPDAERSMLRMGRARCRILQNDLVNGNRPDKVEEAIKDYDVAIGIMEDDFKRNPNKPLYSEYPDALVRRALAYEGLAKWEPAVDDYSRAIALWRPPDNRADIPLRGNAVPQEGDGLGVNPLVLNFRANALSQLGKYNEALLDYQEATDIFLNDGELRQASLSRSNEALALYGVGETEQSQKVMQAVIRKDPGITDMHVALAAIYWDQKEAGRAETEWQFACERIDTGCQKYKDLEWVRGIRRWPPPLVDKLAAFLKQDSSR